MAVSAALEQRRCEGTRNQRDGVMKVAIVP
jgi:hypothetical protein